MAVNRLADEYPYAYSDFYPSRTPCVFKSGPDWPVRKGPLGQGVEREARPVYEWTFINPLAYANAGEAKPFCSLILFIGVKPYSLLYEAAVAATAVIKEILAEAGFPDIEVAFVESIVTRSLATGPKLLSFDPLFNNVPDLRKPFTTALGLSIAPLNHPHFEGTAALYFRLSKDDKRTAILTCAHVARPPPVYGNTGMTGGNTGRQPREEFVALGNMGYTNAVKAMMHTIGYLLYSIDAWNNALVRLGELVEGEDEETTERRRQYEELVANATKKIKEVNTLHDEVTKRRTTPDQRVIGFALHSERIEVSVKLHGFTKDWGLIELYEEKIDWFTFQGNKVYIGGNLSLTDFWKTMFSQPVDQANYRYPRDGLLQAYGVVQDDEFRNPQHLDVHGEKCLLVVKNGLTTGTTVGRTNGLESFTRTYDDHGIKQTSIEIAVLPYDKTHGKFFEAGDSGSVVLARDGRIVGILTGGAGPMDETQTAYLTPYWWIEQQIKAKFPDSFLYEVVQ
ncbi:hypothetical protein EDB92DRAFT_1936392 [Lactarius akahatsu]|uniref:Uncharacterized protein n=1 Tax=Lactarius akahatsu TaxID=416441 RepID=A0AAD4LFI1_9AGAM|nr:hypothetical protein EDB92DRAFT_1936392 [Lactarius akahatsu]